MILPLLSLALSCGPKEVPPHLRVETDRQPTEPTAPPQSVDEALAQLLRGDPLARRADPGTTGAWAGIPDASPLVAWAAVARKRDPGPADWSELEAAWRGTAAVPLARGARLAAVESIVATPRPADDAGRAILPWLGPVVVDAVTLPAGARGPLEWLASDPEQAPGAAVQIAERRVLLGWLDGPDIPVAAAADALEPGVHDRLLDSPTGALLVARARDSANTDAAKIGQKALDRATTLALRQVAADRDAEQRAWRKERTKLVDELGEDPIAALLGQAREGLIAGASNDTHSALALVALTAERLHGSCPDRPCTGLDRAQTLGVATRWDHAAQPAASAWRVIALKAAIDRLEVTRERVGVPTAWTDLADALHGTAEGSIHHGLLRTRAPTEATWLALSRLAGGQDATTWEGAQSALYAHLVDVTEEARAAVRPAEQAELLQRIQRRAARATGEAP